MVFSKIKNRILIKRKKKLLFKLATVQPEQDKWFCNKTSSISITDGSTSEDIVIGKRVWMWGRLNSQHGGKIIIGDYTQIGVGDVFNAVDNITIGSYVTFAPNVSIDDNNNHPVSPTFRKYMRIMGDEDSCKWKYADHAPVVIGDNCWIGRNSSIMKGVVIGENSVVAACSVVTKSVPPNSMVAGNPAKIVKTNVNEIPAPTECEGYNNYVQSLKG